MMRVLIIFPILLVLVFIGWATSPIMGTGGLRRMVTLTGVYPVCRPGGYEVVCFLDADSKEGGLFCMSLSMATSDGKCVK